eukprot:4538091-Pyramimonas_sp.AAC.1
MGDLRGLGNFGTVETRRDVEELGDVGEDRHAPLGVGASWNFRAAPLSGDSTAPREVLPLRR